MSIQNDLHIYNLIISIYIYYIYTIQKYNGLYLTSDRLICFNSFQINAAYRIERLSHVISRPSRSSEAYSPWAQEMQGKGSAWLKKGKWIGLCLTANFSRAPKLHLFNRSLNEFWDF